MIADERYRAFEEVLWETARDVLPPSAFEPRALAAAIVERSRRYTTERARLSEKESSRSVARDLAARILFFGVADAAKVAFPLAELKSRALVPPGASLRLLDVGAGPGTMTFGVALALGRSLDAIGVDQDRDALAFFERAAGRLRESHVVDVTVRTVSLDLRRDELPAGPFDLVTVGMVLNELPTDARLPLVRALLDRLSDDGALLIVEPALRETARALHRLRDALLALGAAHVFAPCTRAGPCPALDDERDWCHEDRPFALPPRLLSLARATGLRTGGLKFSYLTLRRRPAPQVETPPGRRALRVVSDVLDQKGTIERIVCGDDGRALLRLLRRRRTESHHLLHSARRGDTLVVDADGVIVELVRP